MQIKQEIIWQPHTGPQTEVLTRNENEILFGGSRGGGKTDAGLAWLLRPIGEPRYRFLVIRRNSKDLDDWIDRAKYMWRGTGAVFVQGEVRFPSGAVGRFGHLHDDDAYERYQGHEYQRMLIEELTHIPNENLYLKLKASCRSTVPGLRPQVFATTNPGGQGHAWVRDRFVARATPGTRYTSPEGLTRVFIPARVYDNPTLIKNDPGYVKMLEELPDNLRKAWLEGSWDDFEVEGAFYAKELDEAQREGRIGKYEALPGVPVHTWWDLGMGDATAIWFGQRIGDKIRFIDYYENSGESLQFYRNILRVKNYRYGTFHFPHDIRVRELGTGKSRLETAEDLGMNPTEIVPGLSVEDGINAVRMNFRHFTFNEETCRMGLFHLKNYRKERDEARNVWKAKPRHDEHSNGADALRYVAVSYGGSGKTEIRSTFHARVPEEETIHGAVPVSSVEDFDAFGSV